MNFAQWVYALAALFAAALAAQPWISERLDISRKQKREFRRMAASVSQTLASVANYDISDGKTKLEIRQICAQLQSVSAELGEEKAPGASVSAKRDSLERIRALESKKGAAWSRFEALLGKEKRVLDYLSQAEMDLMEREDGALRSEWQIVKDLSLNDVLKAHDFIEAKKRKAQ